MSTPDEAKALEILDRITQNLFVGIDIGSLDASGECIFEMLPDGTMKVISMNTFYRTIDLEAMRLSKP
ncbi:hypothetical protein G6L30_17235 [Agrobacterium rhizogenes]|nr:hypothetical protein [Rhizobium rhizogenes]